MRQLPSHYSLDVEYCHVPSNPNIPNERAVRGSAASPSVVRSALEAATKAPKGHRPQISIQHELDRAKWLRFARSDYVDWLRATRDALSPVLELMRESYGP